MKINKNTSIEDLVDFVPGSVKYMMTKGIKCVACGEPIWGTLEDAAKEKGFGDEDIECFVSDLNALLEDQKNEDGKPTKISTKKLDT